MANFWRHATPRKDFGKNFFRVFKEFHILFNTKNNTALGQLDCCTALFMFYYICGRHVKIQLTLPLYMYILFSHLHFMEI